MRFLPSLVSLCLLGSGLTGCAMTHHNLGPNDAQVFAYHTGENGLFVSVYYLVTENNVVLFDVPMLQGDVLGLSQEIRINSSSALDTIFLTSPLPERYAGAGELVSSSGATLLASEGTTLLIENGMDETSHLFITETAGAILPTVIMEPDDTFDVPSFRRIDGVRLLLVDGGAGPAGGMAAAYLPQLKTLIPGSLVFNKVHPRLTGHRSDVWIASLEELSELDLERVMPGTGKTSGPGLISESIVYLRFLQETVAEVKPEGEFLNEGLQDALVQAMVTRFPAYKLSSVLPVSLKDEWMRQGGQLPVSIEISDVDQKKSGRVSSPQPAEETVPSSNNADVKNEAKPTRW